MARCERSCKSCACKGAARVRPGGDSGLPVAEDPLSGGKVQPFGECRQHHGDLVEEVVGRNERSVAPSSERRAAGLAAKDLNALSMTMRTISKRRE